jgi:hypothetical protein
MLSLLFKQSKKNGFQLVRIGLIRWGAHYWELSEDRLQGMQIKIQVLVFGLL